MTHVTVYFSAVIPVVAVQWMTHVTVYISAVIIPVVKVQQKVQPFPQDIPFSHLSHVPHLQGVQSSHFCSHHSSGEIIIPVVMVR